ncbi:conjugative transfer signal peptidase TraF [Escherichia coli]|nr:conjugative transfer signal peptidase TraF [Escherichia coli]
MSPATLGAVVAVSSRNQVLKRTMSTVAIGGAAIVLGGILLMLAGARVNTSKSIPVGLYWLIDSPVQKGAYVVFCPPQSAVFDEAKQRGYIGSGFCAGGYGYMMKRVLAAKDDAVTFTNDGVKVNGALLPLSRPLKADLAGRPLPQYKASNQLLNAQEFLLMSDISGTSFDGRYFGPISDNQLRGVIRPVLTW